MVDTPDLKSVDLTVVPVRVRPAALFLFPNAGWVRGNGYEIVAELRDFQQDSWHGGC
jgi:hypothetical protein